MGGRRDRALAWAGSEGFQNYAEAFQASWTDRADAATLLAMVGARPQCRRSRVRALLATSFEGLVRKYRPRPQGLERPGSDGAERGA